MQVELIAKNEELIAIYNRHADQESRSRKERQALTHRLDKMKAEIEKVRQNKW
jgi:hypothetical protein